MGRGRNGVLTQNKKGQTIAEAICTKYVSKRSKKRNFLISESELEELKKSRPSRLVSIVADLSVQKPGIISACSLTRDIMDIIYVNVMLSF